ncbi:hypothetical protein ACFYWX_09875 [Streptomyces sp. NPDC002888]|uniref:hypothetical protein n=1 Tax=Streptomyces sp. NPDC002888 TaxID=3364668 RepID=UPI0036B45D84
MNSPEPELLPDLPPAAGAAQAAVADMRATARWSVATTGAVGGLLLGGFPLTAVGKIHGATDVALAVGGLVVAVAGVAWALWTTGEVLTPRFTTLRSLADPALADLQAEIDAAPETFFGPFGRTAAQLEAACREHTAVAVQLAALLARERDEERRAGLTRGLADARANAANATARRRALLELVHAWQVRRALRRARIHTLLASVAVVAGAVLFLLATDGG